MAVLANLKHLNHRFKLKLKFENEVFPVIAFGGPSVHVPPSLARCPAPPASTPRFRPPRMPCLHLLVCIIILYKAVFCIRRIIAPSPENRKPIDCLFASKLCIRSLPKQSPSWTPSNSPTRPPVHLHIPPRSRTDTTGHQQGLLGPLGSTRLKCLAKSKTQMAATSRAILAVQLL
jgi:hypothetical protein